jgi:peptidoglycan/LPS O-acetylase OafA/YrhL
MSGHMNKLGIILGVLVLAIALAAAPMPLTTTLQNPPRSVTIYPNILFAVPLILLGVLLLLYGFTVKK